MKLTIDSYTEPLTVEVTKSGEVVETIELELDFRDSNLLKLKEMAHGIAEAAASITEGSSDEEVLKASESTVERASAVIDLLAGEGATRRIIDAFGKAYEPIDCMNAVIEVWKSLNEECVKRASQGRVKAVSKYLDAQA